MKYSSLKMAGSLFNSFPLIISLVVSVLITYRKQIRYFSIFFLFLCVYIIVYLTNFYLLRILK